LADIWLMRHAHYQGHLSGHHALPDAPLSDEGRAQARRAACSLPQGIANVVTSTLPRARETAEVICQHTGLPLIAASDAFTEWRAPSSVLGIGPRDYPPSYRGWREQRLTRPDLRCEDGESLLDLHYRATEAAVQLAMTARKGGVLLVSHTVFLGVLTRLQEGPTAFGAAVTQSWAFAELRATAT
jgi:broad specificity phosphatase PhoE